MGCVPCHAGWRPSNYHSDFASRRAREAVVVARAREGGCGLACFAGLREAQLPGCHAKSAGFQTQKPWQQPVAWESGHQSRKCSISVTISQNAETHGEKERKLAKVESLASVETRRRMPPSLLPCFPPAYFSLTPPAVLHLASVSCPPMGKEEGQSCLPSRNNGRSPSAARAVDVRAFTRPQSLPARFSAFIFLSLRLRVNLIRINILGLSLRNTAHRVSRCHDPLSRAPPVWYLPWLWQN